MRDANLLSRGTFVSSTGEGNVFAQAFYTGASGLDLMGFHSYESVSDVLDVTVVRYSPDNGRTWSEPVEWKTLEACDGGWRLRFYSCGFVDPASGRLLVFLSEGVFPLPRIVRGEGFRHLRYIVSDNGGRSFAESVPIIHKGEAFDQTHPVPCIHIGKNEFSIGDVACCPIGLEDGAILVPFQFPQLDDQGEIYAPHDGTDHYWASAVLIGRWAGDGGLEWEMSQPLFGDPEKLTLGLFEPTLERLTNGDVLMILRGANHGRPDLPAHRWMARSRDGGKTWSQPEPWTYEEGGAFFSPSSTSQLLRLSSGRLLWIGNISPDNCDGNGPRYPLVFGDVDGQTGLLVRESLRVIDTRREGESEGMSLSNFYAREDRETGDLMLHMWRYAATGAAADPAHYADSLVYRIDPADTAGES